MATGAVALVAMVTGCSAESGRVQSNVTWAQAKATAQARELEIVLLVLSEEIVDIAQHEEGTLFRCYGAGMLPEWTPDPDTVYADLSYRDVLQTGQDLGVVWDGNNPRSNPAFEHDDYYVGPNDQVLDRADNGSLGRPTVSVPKDYFVVLTENHNLIATDDPANERALRHMRKLVSE